MDVGADGTHSATQTSAIKVTEKRKKLTPKNKRKEASQEIFPGGIGRNPTSGTIVHKQNKAKHSITRGCPQLVCRKSKNIFFIDIKGCITATRPSLFVDLLNPTLMWRLS